MSAFFANTFIYFFRIFEQETYDQNNNFDTIIKIILTCYSLLASFVDSQCWFCVLQADLLP